LAACRAHIYLETSYGMAACGAHICSETLTNTLELHVARQKGTK